MLNFLNKHTRKVEIHYRLGRVRGEKAVEGSEEDLK